MNSSAMESSYLNKYREEIAPILERIDLMMKTYEKPFSVELTAKVLGLKKKEVKAIMERYGFKKINRVGFFCVMENGSSEVCRLYQREVAVGSPFTYSKEEIAYIYGLDTGEVGSACDHLGIKEATFLTLPILFSVIPLKNG